MTKESLSRQQAPVKARDYSAQLRELGAIGALRPIQAMCDEEGQPMHEVLGRCKEPGFCRARWRAWAWLHGERRLRADQIAEIWGVAASTVWYGLGRLQPAQTLSLEECRARLERLEAVPLAETLCADAGIGLPELMSDSKRPAVVTARRRLWRALVSVGRRAADIAAQWGMDESSVRLAREAA